MRLPLAAALAAWLGVTAARCTPPPAVQVWLTTGDRAKLLSREPDIRFARDSDSAAAIEVDEGTRYQEIVGFGAAITDASAWLIQNRLTPRAREALLRDLFGRAPGIGLSFTRLTIGASDFSLRHYSLDDVPPGESDAALARFSLDPNRNDVLPVVQRARAINPQLKVMASPWSAPAWMKTTGSLVKGTLRPEAYGPYAEYFRRYIDGYAAWGVPIFAITIQNEPHFEPADYPGMRLDPPARARFIGEYLGPLLARARIHTLIFDWDHNWDEPQSPLQVLGDSVARRIASTSPEGLDNVAFRNVEGSKALIVVNSGAAERSFAVRWGGRTLRYTLPAGAVVTLVWR